MFGALGGALARSSLAFVSQAALAAGIPGRIGLSKPAVAVRDCRSVTKADMIHNDYAPRVSVDPETYVVVADGEALVCEPAAVLPMAQRYFLF
jgi:urease subunit alpha